MLTFPSPVAKSQRGGEGEGALPDLSPTAVPGARQILPEPRGPGKHSVLSHKQEKDVSQISLYLSPRENAIYLSLLRILS